MIIYIINFVFLNRFFSFWCKRCLWEYFKFQASFIHVVYLIRCVGFREILKFGFVGRIADIYIYCRFNFPTNTQLTGVRILFSIHSILALNFIPSSSSFGNIIFVFSWIGLEGFFFCRANHMYSALCSCHFESLSFFFYFDEFCSILSFILI